MRRLISAFVITSASLFYAQFALRAASAELPDQPASSPPLRGAPSGSPSLLRVMPATATPAASQTGTVAVDPLEATRQVEEQIAKLSELPIAKEMMKIQEQIKAAHSETTKKVEPLQSELKRLAESEEGKSYKKELSDLQRQRNETWQRERKAIAEAARTIYAARHEELRKSASHPAAQLGRLGFDILSYPRMDGSTSTHPLSIIIACKALGVPYEWVYPEPTGYPYHNRPALSPDLFWPMASAASLEPADMEFNLAASRVVARPAAPEQARLAIIINSLLGVNATTHFAYENLINGKCDLNLTARAPSEDELKLAAEKGVKIELRPIARDALVFIVNYKNMVKGLTRQELVEIYDGATLSPPTPFASDRTKTWAEFGWQPTDNDLRSHSTKVVPLRRERNSGSRELFDSLIMDGRPQPDPTPQTRQMFSQSMSGPYNQVTVEPMALGYSVYYYEHFMAASPFTRTIAIDGVEPTAETIASGKYPLVAEVYAAYRAGQSADSSAMKMLNWLLSEEGQAVVKESGYVSIRK